MKTLIILFVAMMAFNVQSFAQSNSLHSFKVETIDGEEIELSAFKGKKILVVNTASKCGLTPQYEGLQKLYDNYKDQDFVIIGFPANNFLKQEPGTNDEIKSFCSVNYGVSFPMMAKISVKGKDIAPIYKWLTLKEENGKMDSKVQWNFQKYLINEEGELVGYLSPKEKPDSEKLKEWIEKGIFE